MTDTQFNNRLGTLTPDKSLHIQRRLPGPIERVWAYLTDSDLRRQWLASGTMPLQAGASFELVWRNDELSMSADERPEGFSAESRATCQFIEVEPPRRMRYIWPGVGDVSMELEALGNDVLLTLTHRQLIGERLILNVCAGWHAHLALLVARLEDDSVPSLWSTWKKLRAEYEEQLCAS
ncbi:SRPBCC family protein [Hylemonella sp. W303a]|uniref:SRPBCC family protein n=1 Tax=Hylemonella sp. W303a TaxID=3389873 RepID=UPI00396B3D14